MAAIYYSPVLRRQDRLLLSLVSTVAILVPLGFGMYRAYYGYTHYGPAAASSWSFPWLGVATLLFLAWLALFTLLARRSGYGILLYRNGLRVGNIEPPAWRYPTRLPPILPWEEVAGIAVELIASSQGKPPFHRATLFLKGNRRIYLAEARSWWDVFAGLFGPVRVENLPELVTRIKARLYPRLLPKLRAVFLSGQVLPFGPVIIQRQQFAFRSKSRTLAREGKGVPWSKVGRVTVQSGDLVVELENSKSTYTKLRFPVSKIPNLELLLNLIEEHLC